MATRSLILLEVGTGTLNKPRVLLRVAIPHSFAVTGPNSDVGSGPATAKAARYGLLDSCNVLWQRSGMLMRNPAYHAIRATILAAMLNMGIQVPPAHADTPDALSAIIDTADRICGFVAAQGETDSTKVTGEVRAELSGLAKRLASIGVSGASDITSSKYQGVLQNDLPSALKDVRECKLKVFDKLLAIVFSGTTQSSSPGAPSAVVNPVQQKCIELADQVMTRSATSGMHTSYGEDVAQRAAETMKALGCASAGR